MNRSQRVVLVLGALLVLGVVWVGPLFSPLVLLVRIVGVAVATAFVWLALHHLPAR